MIPLKLIAIGLLANIVVCQAGSIEYNNCPKGCTCEEKSIGTIMTCNRLLTDSEKTNIPVMHFEVIQSKEPLSLKAGCFLNMGLKHVNSITISNNSILYMDKQAFQGLPELFTVKIAHTNITHIHPDTFKQNVNLKKVALVANPSLNNINLNSPHLEELVITNGYLRTITADMFINIPTLDHVDLRNNNIDTIMPNTFDSLVHLDELYLAHNNLKALPKTLFAKNVISVLDLSHNSLETFDNEMLHNMNNLDISYNRIKHIGPKTFGKMEKLTALDLSGNDLRDLDENIFINNSHIQKLVLDNNIHLDKLPENGFQVRENNFEIHSFSCKNCNLQSLAKDTFKTMTSMLILNLSHNKITDISTGVFQSLTNIRDIDLSYNEISTIDDDTFKYNFNVNKVILSHNTLKALHPTAFQNNQNLDSLDISSCGLFKLWTSLTETVKLPTIIALNISNNKIDIISKADIAVTNKVKYLDMSNNPVVCSPELKELVKYLYYHNIENAIYVTHENLNFDDRQNYTNGWKQVVLKACSDTNVEDGMDDDDEDDMDDDSEEKLEEQEENIEYDVVVRSNINIEIEEQPRELLEKEHLDYSYKEIEEQRQHLGYSYMLLALVFIGTAIAVLAIVTNVILFVIRRRQALHVPTIIAGGIVPRLKKNSGLVYQPLSEEHGPKTPILSRFVPGVATAPCDPENNI